MYNAEVLALYNNSWGDFDFNATLGGNMYKVDNLTTVVTAQDMQIRDVVALMSFNESSITQYTYRKQISSAFAALDRKSTRLNSSHVRISYAVFCLKKKTKKTKNKN